jgi:hypothetical protein
LNPNLPEVTQASRFRAGQSGNPGGRPKHKPLTDELVRLLKAKPDGSAQTNARLVAEKLIANARAGDVPSARLLFEYVEGKPVQPVEIEIRETAERIAAESGLDATELIRRAEAIVGARG